MCGFPSLSYYKTQSSSRLPHPVVLVIFSSLLLSWFLSVRYRYCSFISWGLVTYSFSLYFDKLWLSVTSAAERIFFVEG